MGRLEHIESLEQMGRLEHIESLEQMGRLELVGGELIRLLEYMGRSE
jgi:hypothetical protein